MPAFLATRRGAWPRAAWPLFVFLLALMAPGCTRDAASPKRHGVPIALRVRFVDSAAPIASPAAETTERGDKTAQIDAIEQLVISAYENAEFPVLRASQSIVIAPGQQHWSVEFSVPPADSYTITVDANGVFGSGERASLPGTLYYGSTDLANVTAGSTPSAEVVVRRIVPTPTLERSAGNSYTVRWSGITGATNYRLRETVGGGIPQDIVTNDVSVPIQIRGLRERFGPAAEAVSYRVRAEFDDRLREGFTSAFSESVQVILPGNVAPAAVTDLVVASAGPDSIVLEWTSPGDDGAVGQAQRYDLRSSFQPIDEQNFATATVVLGTPTPSPAGRRERLILRGLLVETTYFFALKTADEVPNWSPLSNVTQVTTPPGADVFAPAAITTLSAIAVRDGEVDLRWTATGDDGQSGTASRREVRWSPNPITDGNFASATLAPDPNAPAASGATEELTVRDLPRRATLNFAIRTFDEANNASPVSNVVTVTLPDLQAPGAVTDLRAQDVGTVSVTLAWTATGDDGANGQAEGYQLRYSTATINESNFLDAAQVGGLPNPAPSGSTESVTVGNLDPNTTYFFALRVNDLAGNLSPLSNVPSATTGSLVPAAPSDLIATAITDTTVALDWIDHASNETGYLVERVRPSDPGQVVRFVLNRSFEGHVTFTDTQVIDRTDYRYRVLARNDAGDSAPSNDLLLHTGVRAPRGLAISEATVNSLRLSWSYTALAPELFRIERRTGSDVWSLVTSVEGASTTYVDVALDPSTNYTYRVIAIADALESAPSNEANGRTLDPLGICEITPTSLDFGIVLLQSDSTRTITIENIGTGPLVVAPSLETGCVDFAIVGGGDPVTLAPNDTRLVSVRFTPSSAEPRSCDLLLGNACSRLPLSGVGALPPQCDVEPTSIAFGDVLVGSTLTRDVTIRNAGGGFLDGTVVSPPCNDFEVVAGLGAYHLGSGETRVVTIEFAPAQSGAQGCSFASGCGLSVDLSGSGIVAPLCQVSPVSIDFGPIEIGSTSSRGFTVTNIGGGLLSGNVTDPGCPGFSILGGLGPYDLLSGQFVEVTVAFSPVSTGPASCSIDLGSGCGEDVLCQGTGTQPPLCQPSTSLLNFGLVDVGDFVDDSFTLTNGGGGTLTGTIVLPDCNYWTVLSGDGPYSLGPGEQRTVILRFTPNAPGDFFECTVDLGCGESVTLRGTGVDPNSYWLDTFNATPFNNYVATVLYQAPNLYVGGDFTAIPGQQIDRVAVYNGDTWTALGNGLSGHVQQLTPWNSGIVATGELSVEGNLASFDGGNWELLGGGTDTGTTAATVFGGDLVIGGSFSNIFSGPASHVARLSSAGGVLDSMGTGVGNLPNCLQVYNNQLFIGGYFGPESAPLQGIGRWNGSSWVGVGGGVGVDGSDWVNCMTVWNNRLVIGGRFTTAGGVSCNNIVTYNGSSFQRLGTGTDDIVYAVAVYQGDLIAAGDFTSAGGVSCSHIARWDGSRWKPMGSGISGGLARPFSIAVDGDNLYVGGSFSSAGGHSSQYMAHYYRPVPAARAPHGIGRGSSPQR